MTETQSITFGLHGLREKQAVAQIYEKVTETFFHCRLSLCRGKVPVNFKMIVIDPLNTDEEIKSQKSLQSLHVWNLLQKLFGS